MLRSPGLLHAVKAAVRATVMSPPVASQVRPLICIPRPRLTNRLSLTLVARLAPALAMTQPPPNPHKNCPHQRTEKCAPASRGQSEARKGDKSAAVRLGPLAPIRYHTAIA